MIWILFYGIVLLFLPLYLLDYNFIFPSLIPRNISAENVSYNLAFLAGVLSFFSPCVLPLVPAYIANLAGESAIDKTTNKNLLHTMLHSISFIIGFSMVFIVIGASVGWLSTLITFNQAILKYIAGTLIIIFGIFMLVSSKIPWLNYEKRMQITTTRNPGYLRSLIIGCAFAFGWTPCVGPVLAAILTYASSTQDISKSVLLLCFYSLGLGIPFLLIGLTWGIITPLWRNMNRYLFLISLCSGILLIVVGILIMTDNLSWLSQFAT